MSSMQATRAIEVFTPLGGDELLFYRMTATEELGRLFQFDMDLLSKNPNIPLDQILGQRMTVRLELPEKKDRFFNGFVSLAGQGGAMGDFNLYHVTLHPWLWFLTRTSDCRIFQNMAVPDIIKSLFKDNGFTDLEDRLSSSYLVREYCVQYRETDFNFVSRLMEQEGIYYYFKHEANKHTLVLADGIPGHEPFPGYEQIPYFPPDAQFHRERDHIYEWSVSRTIQTDMVALNDYDFKKPRADLNVKAKMFRDYPHLDGEFYDYPGQYTETEHGETFARVRIEEHHADYERAAGQANARGLSSGSLFILKDHYRQDQNQQYLIVGATHFLTSDLYFSGSASSDPEVYFCNFEVIPSNEEFRPARITPKPTVQGPQTAGVVGPSGEEIWTDKYGRIKVKFHWDRYARGDESSSCWIRVAQFWAGPKWGSIHIPRIGQEVIVKFLEGDPDRPIITGRVYNKDNMPPYDLPANATQSGIRTRSAKDGGPANFNEIRFEDKKGDEHLFIHAERNQDVRIKNDRYEWAGNESHLVVQKDLLQLVEGDRHVTVKKVQNEKVDGTVSLKAGKDLQEKVGMNYALDAGMESHAKAGMNIVVEAGMSITLKAGGGFVVVGPAGVTISGTPVLINSGGAAGSGSGCSPGTPTKPREADHLVPGEESSKGIKECPYTCSKTSNGVMLKPNPDKTTTVLGRFDKDMDRIIKELEIPKDIDFDAKKGGFNILNVPDEMWKNPDQFWKEVNQPFLDKAIERGDDIVMATDPEDVNNLMRNGKLTGFGREVRHLIKNRYKYDSVTKMMVK